MKVVFLFFLLWMAGPLYSQSGSVYQKYPGETNTLLWEVSGNGLAKPSFIFGTFHLLCEDDIHFSEAWQQAITNSSEVYLELDMDDPATLLGGLMLMNMKDGKKLKDLYSEMEYKRVSDFFKDSLQTPIGIFQRMKPVFLASFLYPKMMPCAQPISVEDAVMKTAKAQDKEIKGLETMAFQASLFDNIPYEKQAKELLDMIDSINNYKLNFETMLNSYRNQRLDELGKMLTDPDFGFEENQAELLDNRNKNWVGQLKNIMVNQTVFVAVGAGHLIGENGLIALLRAAGFTVKGLENR
ncbi:MAG: TraB/GumN family protein [Chitinophagaceae bacterium]|nr:TraB/GumN family protein [Chitinophagaceae bacterium]